MYNNYRVAYEIINMYSWWAKRIVRIVIPYKVYFYDLFVGVQVMMFKFLPLRPYMNNTGFNL
jgi:hypothetical protein